MVETDIRKDERLSGLYDAQLKPTDALTGELGIFSHKDGGFSTEKSTTVEVDGKWMNIPMLVKGQSPEAVQRILYGKPSQEDYHIAVKRAIQRSKKFNLPTYNNMQDAVRAAIARSNSK